MDLFDDASGGGAAADKPAGATPPPPAPPAHPPEPAPQPAPRDVPVSDADITLPPSSFKARVQLPPLPPPSPQSAAEPAPAPAPAALQTLPPPGWHGKLPSLGDFASRRLDAAFIAHWDEWLARGLLSLREAEPEAWLPAYLASPSWRFLLMPGALPGSAGLSAWAGVLMPSVDRVGRYFPLTLVQNLGPGPTTPHSLQTLWPWLGHLDDLAQDALHDDWSVDRLEAELLRMTPLPAPPALAPGSAGRAHNPVAGSLRELSLPGATDAALHLAQQAQALWLQQAAGQAWWYACPDAQPARFWQSSGLPLAQAVGFLFAAGAGPQPGLQRL